MKWRYYQTGLYTEKKRSHWLKQWPIRKGLGDKKRRIVIGWRCNLDFVKMLEQSTNGKLKRFRRSSRSKRIIFVCREEDSEIWWKSLPGQKDEMECKLEQGQRICPYCNVRHIGRCQEDVDRWRIREIVRDWCPHQGGEGFDGCVEWEDWQSILGCVVWFTLLSAETCNQRSDCHSGKQIGRLHCFDDGKVARLSLLLVRAVGL